MLFRSDLVDDRDVDVPLRHARVLLALELVHDHAASRLARAAADRVHLAAAEVLNDPLPYGIAPNQQTLQDLMAHAVTQRIIPRPMPLDTLFAAETRELVG